jgi:predicted O-methyltransferase YrrM
MSFAGKLYSRVLQLAVDRMLREWWRHETNPLNVLQRAATRESADYIAEHGGTAILYHDRKRHLLEALNAAPAEGLILEFGVNRGDSIRWIADEVAPRQVHGFDSFAGLPDGGGGTFWHKHQFDQGSRLPKVPSNVMLHQGWFSDTLPSFLSSQSEQTVGFVHIDCDLYESTRDIFEILEPYFVPGTVIVFDEYYNVPNWRQHEYRAFLEFRERAKFDHEYIGFSVQQASAVLGKNGS